jgi:hypothetical protein
VLSAWLCHHRSARSLRTRSNSLLLALAVVCWLTQSWQVTVAQVGGYAPPPQSFLTTTLLQQDELPMPSRGIPELPSTDVMRSPLAGEAAPGTAGVTNGFAQPQQPYFDMDQYLDSYPGAYVGGEPWDWQLLPTGIIYKSYLAGAKESRISAHIVSERDHDAMWDATLGGRVGILRYGNADPINPEGFQFDVEGSAQVRLDIMNDVDVQAVDFRGGVPLTYGCGPHRFKFGYYHLSSHLGDEFLLDNPGYPRLNFARDVLIFGYSYYWTQKLRLYAETGWAFYTDVSKEWEFQFGLDWAPTQPTGTYGASFFAINAHLREELDFGGNLTVEAGWAWLGNQNTHLLRTGLVYYNGGSPQYSFYREHEEQIGFGLWYDY